MTSFTLLDLFSARHRREHRRTETALRYITKLLQPKLGFTSYKMMLDHGPRKLFAAECPSGPVFIKLYDATDLAGARVAAAVDSHLVRHGIPTPNLLMANLDGNAPGNYGWGSLVYRFVPGEDIPLDAVVRVKEAFSLLARFHSIGHDLPHENLKPNIPEADARWAKMNVSRKIDQLRKAGIHVPTEEQRRIVAWIDPLLDDLYKSDWKPGLLHFDYVPHNVLIEPDSAMHIIDFDDVRTGPFVLDLARSLIHFRYGVRTEALANATFDEVINPRHSEQFLSAYFDKASPQDLDLWNRHQKSAFAWACIKTAGNTAMRSRDIVRYDRTARRQLRDFAQRQWRNLVHGLCR